MSIDKMALVRGENPHLRRLIRLGTRRAMFDCRNFMIFDEPGLKSPIYTARVKISTSVNRIVIEIGNFVFIRRKVTTVRFNEVEKTFGDFLVKGVPYVVKDTTKPGYDDVILWHDVKLKPDDELKKLFETMMIEAAEKYDDEF